jgi:hypothetical protein
VSTTRLHRLKPFGLTWSHITWSRVGAALCVALIVSGAVSALLPDHHGAQPLRLSLLRGTSDQPSQVLAQSRAAQQVAEAFVVASDTTDPAHPAGDVATETALAPSLVVRHEVGPALWRAQDRTTTVALDPAGQPVAVRSNRVAVIVTGIMTVTSDSAPPASVPIAERITLRPQGDGRSARNRSADQRGGSGWQVVGVEVGA